MKTAVTGAAGHVGANLCRELLKQGHSVKALYHHDTRALDELEIIKIKGDILDPGCLIDLCKGTDLVFHSAAKISIDGDADRSVCQINVQGTKNIVQACVQSNVKRLIHFSSIHALKQNPLQEELNETRPLVDKTAFKYDQSKAESERVVLQAVKSGLDAVILSPTAIIGPVDYKPSLMGQAIIDLYNQKIPALISGGFDWVDVRDVATAAIAASKKGRTGERYLLSGTWMSLKGLAKQAEATTGKKTPSVTLPVWLVKIGLPFIKIYCKLNQSRPICTSESLEVLAKGHRNISHEKARQELGFHPRPLRETLQDTFDWFKRAGMIE